MVASGALHPGSGRAFMAQPRVRTDDTVGTPHVTPDTSRRCRVDSLSDKSQLIDSGYANADNGHSKQDASDKCVKIVQHSYSCN